MRPLIAHFTGGTEVSIETETEPHAVFEALEAGGDWLVVTDLDGDRHYLAIGQIAYLAFGSRKGVGFM